MDKITVCKCGMRWELRDSTDEELYYNMCEDCIKKAREKGEIPPKTDYGSLFEEIFYAILEKELE